MWNKFRLRGFCVIAAAFMAASQAQAGYHRNVPNAHAYLEHLVRQSDELLTEVNLTRASQYTVSPTVITTVSRTGGWAGGIYQHLLVDVRQPQRDPEYFIGKMVNNFRMQTIMLYDTWWKVRQTSPAFVAQFQQTDYAYHNAIASVYFYLESLRRTFIIRGAQGRVFNQSVLLQRMVKMERLAWEIRNLMKTIRYATAFGVPNRRFCPETTFMSYRVDVDAVTPQPYIPFPYYHENRFWTTNDIQPVAPAQSGGYDLNYWNQRYDQFDQGYQSGNGVYRDNGPGNVPGLNQNRQPPIPQRNEDQYGGNNYPPTRSPLLPNSGIPNGGPGYDDRNQPPQGPGYNDQNGGYQQQLPPQQQQQQLPPQQQQNVGDGSVAPTSDFDY